MPYRLSFQTPLVVECDTADEVLELAEVATRRAPLDVEVQRTGIAEEPKPRARRQPLLEDRHGPVKARGGTRAATKAAVKYLTEKGKGGRVKEIAEATGFEVDAIAAALAGDEFEPLGRGVFRVAGSNGVAPVDSRLLKPARMQVDPDDEFEDPARQPKPTTKPAGASTLLIDRIKGIIRKHGACSILVIATTLEQPKSLVNDVLRGNPDVFRLHPRAGGWELVA